MTELPKISGPAVRALAEVDCHTLEDVTRHTAKELLALHGMGPKAIRILTEALTAAGLSFRDPDKIER
ncbi:helix-hairpin-helix domain-containing protein [Herbidospora cretacea]|uniref:helix-hairpin-helix domain-containing protein n=1 Tax=Herbidospora cretacea TaxID=28444 RepID=UPI0007732A08|nr:helix-hairpin-helix domain-containing protein [Herbidospora cretacea]